MVDKFFKAKIYEQIFVDCQTLDSTPTNPRKIRRRKCFLKAFFFSSSSSSFFHIYHCFFPHPFRKPPKTVNHRSKRKESTLSHSSSINDYFADFSEMFVFS
eukprot:Sdes_comp15831_c0_seq1m4915